jgi:hypothetical protein
MPVFSIKNGHLVINKKMPYRVYGYYGKNNRRALMIFDSREKAPSYSYRSAIFVFKKNAASFLLSKNLQITIPFSFIDTVSFSANRKAIILKAIKRLTVIFAIFLFLFSVIFFKLLSAILITISKKILKRKSSIAQRKVDNMILFSFFIVLLYVLFLPIYEIKLRYQFFVILVTYGFFYVLWILRKLRSDNA